MGLYFHFACIIRRYIFYQRGYTFVGIRIDQDVWWQPCWYFYSTQLPGLQIQDRNEQALKNNYRIPIRLFRFRQITNYPKGKAYTFLWLHILQPASFAS